ncbi:hypothetical protein EmuJ_000271100 [Echinococcus multilocularis]|uniref:Uncharacterized protein n=1 Tax=Echinococcus multilocularis TaxID=6211 RepID=A0A068XX48_ECHMU|nr:hypothetical protein EmuJ_000271100 [Echinococcus multilocularis]
MTELKVELILQCQMDMNEEGKRGG